MRSKAAVMVDMVTEVKHPLRLTRSMASKVGEKGKSKSEYHKGSLSIIKIKSQMDFATSEGVKDHTDHIQSRGTLWQSQCAMQMHVQWVRVIRNKAPCNQQSSAEAELYAHTSASHEISVKSLKTQVLSM
eukprot:6223515-Amphidinium_carterae.1